MSTDKKFPALRSIALAVAVGAFAGAIAVYVKGGLDGNNAPLQVGGNAAVQTATTAEDSICTVKTEAARRVAEAAIGEVAAMLPADPPRSLPELSFNGPDGDPVTPADFAGKVILVNLWATWCVPCREEMPALDALQAEKGSDAFEVVAINVDRGDDEKPKAFLEEIGIASLDYYRDASMGVFNDLKREGLALGLPVTLLVDDEGCLLANMNGPAEWASEDAKRLIDAALGVGGT